MMMMMQSNARDEALSVAFGGEKEICFDSIPPSLLFDTLLYGRCGCFWDYLVPHPRVLLSCLLTSALAFICFILPLRATHRHPGYL